MCVHLTFRYKKLAAVHPEGRCDWPQLSGGPFGAQVLPYSNGTDELLASSHAGNYLAGCTARFATATRNVVGVPGRPRISKWAFSLPWTYPSA